MIAQGSVTTKQKKAVLISPKMKIRDITIHSNWERMIETA